MPIVTVQVGKEYIIRVPPEKNKQLLFGGLDGKHVVITEVGLDYFKFLSKYEVSAGFGFLFNTHVSWLELVGDLCECPTRTLMLRGCQCGGI